MIGALIVIKVETFLWTKRRSRLTIKKKIGSDDDGNSNDEDDLDEENDERGLESLF